MSGVGSSGRRARGLALVFAAFSGLTGPACHREGNDGDRGATRADRAASGGDASASAPVPPPPRSSLSQINGQSFPDHVLALTWDDGPDRGTLALAEYLARQRVAATFFVVGEWSKELSSDPGEGAGVYETGHAYLRILGQVVALGHRLGNHTLNHRLLTEISPAEADLQVRANQELVDPFLTNELQIFRVPGGAWSAPAATAIAADPYLARLVGPIRWDIDRKDWESSLACQSDPAGTDCEPATTSGAMGPSGRAGRAGQATETQQVRPLVTAQRYLESIDDAKHGIVLFHDRVGHVGSSYAIELARAIVPALKARGYVFAAPVLSFSPLARRAAPASSASPPDAASPAEDLVGIADVDGDGRADACARDGAGVLCALSTELTGSTGDRMPRTVFQGSSRWDLSFGGAAWDPPERGQTIQLADVDGDRRSDLCGLASNGIACALATTPHAFAAPRAWSAGGETYATPLFGDVDGDGKADACGLSPGGILCARSLGNAFGPSRVWLAGPRDAGTGATPWSAPADAGTLALADVNGDGRADVCGRTPAGIQCALSLRTSLARAEVWSSGGDFGDADPIPWTTRVAYRGTIRFGDLNGDGRADVCGRGPDGVVCALSTGRGFTRASNWLRTGMTDADGWLDAPARAQTIRLADINGDGRRDLCVDSLRPGGPGLACGLAP